jgi:hypothetical protein|tara:strand:- start:3975 stop:4205 length:231 start_codon:yes stop_codon:yes gene_type:complete
MPNDIEEWYDKRRFMKCCNENYLVWKEEGEVFPYEIWRCIKCNKEYNVELVRDFKNKELIDELHNKFLKQGGKDEI